MGSLGTQDTCFTETQTCVPWGLRYVIHRDTAKRTETCDPQELRTHLYGLSIGVSQGEPGRCPIMTMAVDRAIDSIPSRLGLTALTALYPVRWQVTCTAQMALFEFLPCTITMSTES